MSSKFSSYCPPNSARIGDLKGRIRWIRSLSFLGRHTGRPLKAEVRYRNVEKVAERKPMKRIMALARVLTLQSHVVHGYVGNRCAAFCLQRLGIETDILHTVQFSNRKGYPALTGDVFSAQQIENLYSGLQQNHLDRHTHVLTGYLGSKEVLQSVAKIIKQAKMRCPDLIYLCDPVMGDDGKLYLPKEMVEAYRSEIVPLAQILVPNLSEVEFLLEREIHDLEMLDAACSELHAMGPSTVIVTSAKDPTAPDSHLTIFGSTIEPQSTGHAMKFIIRVPRMDATFRGTGDLFAALVLALSIDKTKPWDWICEQALSRLDALLKRTEAKNTKNETWIELDLVASQDCLVQTDVCFKAVLLEQAS